MAHADQVSRPGESEHALHKDTGRWDAAMYLGRLLGPLIELQYAGAAGARHPEPLCYALTYAILPLLVCTALALSAWAQARPRKWSRDWKIY
jgi:hypothetical protein